MLAGKVMISWRIHSFLFSILKGDAYGGVMTFANNTTKLDTMQALKELFFPNGKLKMGEMKNFTYEIGNYQIETIPDTFRIADYSNEHGLSRVRLYIMTRKTANSW